MIDIDHNAHGVLAIEGMPLDELAARFGTPLYVYSAAALKAAFGSYQAALQAHGVLNRSLICYAVKANANLAILQLFAELGAGFDIVSGGELSRVLAAGGSAHKVLFSGVGKSRAEMAQALEAGIRCFNVESVSELTKLNEVALAHGVTAPVSLRVNPDVDAKTHPYISTGLKSAKFGVPIADAPRIYRQAAAMAGLRVTGIDCHIGSQLLDAAPAAEAAEKLADLSDALLADGIAIEHLDVGGGMGIRYRREEATVAIADFLQPVLSVLAGRREQLLLEPGRSLVGNAGLLLTRTEVLKHGEEKNFAVIDAAMNDLIRPALYEAWHEIVPVLARPEAAQIYDVVGPICESSDFLGQQRALNVQEGDLLAVLSAGAYGMSMSSNYNSRPRAAEVMVSAGHARLIRRRETLDDMLASELNLPA